MIVRILPEAEAEMEVIGDCIAADSPVRAISFIEELRAKCLELADMPRAFPLVPRYEERGVRHRVHRNYQIFYRLIGDPPERADVLHVVRGARNYAAILFQ